MLFAEVSPSGHRLVYLRLLVQGALERGMRVVIACPAEVRSSPNWDQHLGETANSVEWVPVGSRLTARALARTSRACGVSLVVVPDGDAFAAKQLWRGWRGPTVRVLIMRDPGLQRGGPLHRVKGMSKQVLIGIAGIRSGVELVWLAQFGDPTGRRRRVAFDPFITEEGSLDRARAVRAYRDTMGLEDDVTWFAMVGGLSARKNVLLAADRLAAYGRRRGTNLGLLLVGPIDADLAASPSALRERLPSDLRVVIDAGTKSNDELNRAIVAADRVIVARGLPYPNSTLIKSVALGRPCLFAGPPSAIRRAQRLPGVYTATLEVDEIDQALHRCVVDDGPREHRDGYGHEAFVNALLG